MEEKMLTTRRSHARYGDRMWIAGIPVAVIKSGKRTDFLTAEEFVEDLYGRPVDHIVFREEIESSKS